VRGRPDGNTPYLAQLSEADSGSVTWVQTADAQPNTYARVNFVGVTALGTAVGVGLVAEGEVSYAGDTVAAAAGKETGFLMVAEHDGAPRFIRRLSGNHPVRLEP
jgi:hypothetical protein